MHKERYGRYWIEIHKISVEDKTLYGYRAYPLRSDPAHSIHYFGADSAPQALELAKAVISQLNNQQLQLI